MLDTCPVAAAIQSHWMPESLCHFDPGADFQDHMSMSSTSNWPRNICQGLPRSKLLQDATWEGMEEGRGDVTSTVPGNMLRWGILKRGKTQWTMGHWGTLCGETNPKWAKNLWLWATAMKQTCLRHSRHSLHECLGSLNRKGGLVVKMSFLIQKMTTSGNGLPRC